MSKGHDHHYWRAILTKHSEVNEFQRELMVTLLTPKDNPRHVCDDKCDRMSCGKLPITLDVQTDNYGQLIIYTNLAETQDGALVEFDSNAPAGTYRGYESPDIDNDKG